MSGFSFYFVLTVLSAAACRNNRASPISVPVIYQNTVQLYIIKKSDLKKATHIQMSRSITMKCKPPMVNSKNDGTTNNNKKASESSV